MDDKPVYMLNALWFKADGGARLYQQYLDAAQRVIEELDIGAQPLERFVPEQMLIGDWDPDLFFVVEYPNRAAFDRLVNSDAYRAIAYLREQALEKSLLIQCRKP